MSRLTWRIALLLFGSGYCAVAYQTAWLRLMRLVFGASTAASAAVLAIFMGGLGVGAWLFGRRADRSSNPLQLYAHLEVGVAVFAAASPLLMRFVHYVYVAAGGTPALGIWAGTVLRMILAALVLGPPAILMGGTLPAAVRAGVAETDHGRRAIGLLYGLNTLGAVLGAWATTFFAIELLGTNRAIWVAALANLVVALIARAYARSVAPGGERAAEESAAASADLTPVTVSAPVWLGLTAAFAVGFVFFTMEIVWYRMLAPLLGGSSYTFGLILAVALLGIGVGGYWYGRGSHDRRPTLRDFALVCALEALALAIPFALGDRLAFLAVTLRALGAAGFSSLVLGWGVVAAAVVLPAAIVAGYQFPLLAATLGSARRAVGREVGLLYAWNTAGAIAGSLAAGFGLLPLLTAPGVWRLAVAVLAVLVLAMLVATPAAKTGGPASEDRRGTGTSLGFVPIGGMVAVALALMLTAGPTAFWRHSAIGAGRLALDAQAPNDLRAAITRERASLFWEAEGRESSVAVLRNDIGLAFYVNGKSDGSAVGDAPTQVMSGLVGAALHPRPRTALVIGLGTGSTAGWLAEVPSIERVDVVELEPAVLEVARMCALVNRNCLDNPKIHLHVGDGRELLLTSRQQYDIVFSEPSNPYRVGVSSLFTTEFYRAVRRRLAPGGLLLQWLQGYDVDTAVVRTAYATLASVFPSVESWRVSAADLLLVAGAEPLDHDLDRIRERVAGEPFRRGLEATWGVAGVEGLYTGFLGTPELAVDIAGQAQGRLNSDDRPFIEFGFIRTLGRRNLFNIEALRGAALARGWGRPRTTGQPLDWARVDDLEQARSALFGMPPAEPAERESPGAHRALARRAFVERRPLAISGHWLSQTQPPASRIDLLILTESLALQGDERAPLYIEILRPDWPADADAALAIWHAVRGDLPAARAPLLSAIARWRSEPWILQPMAQGALLLVPRIAIADHEAGRTFFAALEQPFAVQLLESQRRVARLAIAETVDFAGLCGAVFAEFEPDVPWRLALLAARERCYRQIGHPLAARATRDRLRFLEDAPQPLFAPVTPAPPAAPATSSR